MELNHLLAQYGESHQNLRNINIHKICVPAITFTVVGLLTAINWQPFGVLFIFWALSLISIYYIYLSWRYFLMMTPVLGVFTYLSLYLKGLGVLIPVSVTIFVLAWIGQFYGHKIEGKKPSFFTDVKFLLIGPLWTLKTLFKLKD